MRTERAVFSLCSLPLQAAQVMLHWGSVMGPQWDISPRTIPQVPENPTPDCPSLPACLCQNGEVSDDRKFQMTGSVDEALLEVLLPCKSNSRLACWVLVVRILEATNLENEKVVCFKLPSTVSDLSA